MGLQRTLESSEGNTEEDFEKETLSEEEDTSTSDGQEDKNEDDAEEETSTNESKAESKEEEEDDDDSGEDEQSTEDLKAELEQAKSDRDNYKTGMLKAKGKKRGFDEGESTEKKKEVDVNEEAVNKVLSKRTEQEALVNTLMSDHKDYIPELVNDVQYQEIIGYLPRNIDKTSYQSIVKGLKLATKMWKEDKGIKDTKSKKGTDLGTTKSTTSTGKGKAKKSGRSILKGTTSPETWY